MQAKNLITEHDCHELVRIMEAWKEGYRDVPSAPVEYIDCFDRVQRLAEGTIEAMTPFWRMEDGDAAT